MKPLRSLGLCILCLVGCEAPESPESPETGEDLIGDLREPNSLQVLPVGWSPFPGGGPDRLAPLCVAGVDQSSALGGDAVMVIRCEADEASYGGVWKSMNPSEFVGERVRLSASLRADEIGDMAGAEGVGSLWLRAETSVGPIVSNMRDRGIKGSTGWERREAVFQFPDEVRSLMVGFWMQGQGQMYVKDLRLEVATDNPQVDYSQLDRPAPPIRIAPARVQ